MIFHEILAKKLEELGYSHAELAERVWGTGARRSAIYSYLSGKVVPTWDTVVKFAEAFGMEPRELMPATKEGSRFQHALNYVPIDDDVDHIIYVIKCSEFYKIGITKNMGHRISNMRSNNPFEFEVILARMCNSKTRALRIESVAHSRLSKWSQSGEWFHISNDEAAQELDFVIERIKWFSEKDYCDPKELKKIHRSRVSLEVMNLNRKDRSQYTPQFLEFCSENRLNPNSKLSREKFRNWFKQEMG